MSPRTPANYPAGDPDGTTAPILVNDRFVGHARADQHADAQGDPHGVGDTVSRWHGKKKT